VHILDDLSTGKARNLPAAATFHRLDVRSPEAAALLAAERFDVIAHLAAQIDVRKSVDDPRLDADVNIAGTLNLLEALRALPAEQRGRFVFVSTGGALYGEADTIPSPETTPANPDSPYGIAKLSAELYLAAYGRVHGIEGAVLRLGNVYGPRQDPHGEAGVVAIFTGRCLDNQPCTLYGDGKQTRDYVYVGDVARANLLALVHPFVGPVNVGTGVETDVVRLHAAIATATGATAPPVHGPARAGEQRRSVVDPARAGELFGWKPEVSLADGLARTAAHFRALRERAA
jgi:UDP-glucose 4-epimerase